MRGDESPVKVIVRGGSRGWCAAENLQTGLKAPILEGSTGASCRVPKMVRRVHKCPFTPLLIAYSPATPFYKSLARCS